MKRNKIIKSIFLSVFTLVIAAFLIFSIYEGLANNRGPIGAISGYINPHDPVGPKPGDDTDSPSKPDIPSEELPSLKGKFFAQNLSFNLGNGEVAGAYFKDEKTVYAGWTRIENDTLYLLQVNDENIDNLTYTRNDNVLTWVQEGETYNFKYDAEKDRLIYLDNGVENLDLVFSRTEGFSKVFEGPKVPVLTIEGDILTITNVTENSLINLYYKESGSSEEFVYVIGTETTFDLTTLLSRDVNPMKPGMVYTITAKCQLYTDSGTLVWSLISYPLTYSTPKKEASLVGKFFADSADCEINPTDGLLHIVGYYFVTETEVVNAEFKKVDNNLVLIPSNQEKLTYTLSNNLLNFYYKESGKLLYEGCEFLGDRLRFGSDDNSVPLYSDYTEIIYSEV